MPHTLSPCSVIIVCNNSELFLKKTIQSLENQTLLPHEVILIDSGSRNTSYLYELNSNLKIKIVIAEKGIGFCKANNIGMEYIDPTTPFVFFLNPDAFPFRDFIEKAVDFLNNPENKNTGAVTGQTLGFDISINKPTGYYDTTGIFQNWYGKWYDRGQGIQTNPVSYNRIEEVQAICGAVFFCRKKAIKEIMINEREVFREEFYMYKDDIDLSIRLRKKGWKLIYHPKLFAYHCRGWSKNRKQVSRLFRLTSARNELKIHLEQKFIPGILYSLVKFLGVKLFNI